MSQLFTPVTLGELTLPNRMIMAPLTRSRAGAQRVPNTLMRDYYVQRASAGLILTEAIAVTNMGVGYADTPGLWSAEQIAGWRVITDAVHAAGGQIFAQLWHVGRISDPIFLNGHLPVAPSAIAADGEVSLLRPKRRFVTPRALDRSEIPGVIAAYRQAAENALTAGFDGVEIHGANGYLPDQFLQDSTNRRQDDYGGSIQNRARLLLEITDAAVAVWGAGRVGVHLAPRSDSHDMGDSQPRETFGYVARELGRRRIAFLFARERQGEGYLSPFLKESFGGHFIANDGLDQAGAEALLAAGTADSVAFGRLYIANPDLVERFQQGLPLNTLNPQTLYAPGAEGYVDYPFWSAEKMPEPALQAEFAAH